MNEDEKILQKIAMLEDEHRALDAVISGESSVDQLHIKRLKKRKLWLKDEIGQLYAIIHPDIIA